MLSKPVSGSNSLGMTIPIGTMSMRNLGLPDRAKDIPISCRYL